MHTYGGCHNDSYAAPWPCNYPLTALILSCVKHGHSPNGAFVHLNTYLLLSDCPLTALILC